RCWSTTATSGRWSRRPAAWGQAAGPKIGSNATLTGQVLNILEILKTAARTALPRILRISRTHPRSDSMPHLGDPDEQLVHLRKAIADKDRWVLVTNQDTGHLLQLVLASGLIVTGRPDADLGYGVFPCLDGATQRQTAVSFLTVPKRVLPRRHLRRALRGL